ncbi:MULTISPECIES: holo-ACP synthase [unclassified Adlercreutzia]|uniref:holo-ACP synthase n=1 Tax=unclassified Adlercreutzia TaxID=2636013 RepID=UPI0013EC242D|nr:MULTISPECIES: holo-ACP synthase [unclassified Adlercreutzia]
MARSKKAQKTVDGVLGMQGVEGQVGLGVDIVEIERVRRILARTPSFARRVFSETEQAYCDGKADPAVHYATRFAAKEAVVKALGTGFAEGVGVCDIEVRRTSKGRPYVVLTGRAREVAREQGVREIPLSLSFTHAEAVACAMAITEDAVSAAKKRVDPMEELAAQFKEARALLDDLPATGAAATSEGAVGAEGEGAAGAASAAAPKPKVLQGKLL